MNCGECGEELQCPKCILPVLLVYEIGQPVIIDGDIPATIRSITIYNSEWIKYLCVWWDERTRKEEWLSEEEFRPSEPKEQPIHFKA